MRAPLCDGHLHVGEDALEDYEKVGYKQTIITSLDNSTIQTYNLRHIPGVMLPYLFPKHVSIDYNAQQFITLHPVWIIY